MIGYGACSVRTLLMTRTRTSIAVIGTGISGLVCAHRLHPEHDVTVYEANDYVGGHTNTVRVDLADETHWVDTGFIVLNDRNYPNFEPLLDELGVATQPSHMSFSVSDGGGFEYAGTPRGLFAKPGHAVEPALPADDPRPRCGSTARQRAPGAGPRHRARRCASSSTRAATPTGSCSG